MYHKLRISSLLFTIQVKKLDHSKLFFVKLWCRCCKGCFALVVQLFKGLCFGRLDVKRHMYFPHVSLLCSVDLFFVYCRRLVSCRASRKKKKKNIYIVAVQEDRCHSAATEPLQMEREAGLAFCFVWCVLYRKLGVRLHTVPLTT